MQALTNSVGSYRAVLFDLDGTLLDSFDGIVTVFQEVLAGMGVTHVRNEQIREVIGVPLAQCFAMFIESHRVAGATAAYRDIYLTRMHEISPPFPGALEILQGLGAVGVRTGIVSNKRFSAVRAIIDRKGWPIDLILAEGEGLASKPAPDMLWAAFERLKVTAKEVLYVGDSSLDAKASQAAGCSFAGLTTGELKTEQFAEWPNVGVYPSLTTLGAHLLEGKVASSE